MATVYRVKLDSGESILGRRIVDVDAVLSELNVECDPLTVSPEDIIKRVMAGEVGKFRGGWRIERRRVGGEYRAEIKGPDYYDQQNLHDLGVQFERIDVVGRYFIPTVHANQILASILKNRPLMDLQTPSRETDEETAYERPPFNEADVKDAASNPDVIEELNELVLRVAPFAELRFNDRMRDNRGRFVTGKFTRQVRRAIIEVALSVNPMRSLRHEVIHALRAAGVFNQREWGILLTAAKRGKWIERFDVINRYPELFVNGKPTEKAYEEAIADAFGAYRDDSKAVPKPTAKLLTRIKEFFVALVDALRALGYPTTADQIFKDIDAGVYGTRAWRRQMDVDMAGVPQYARGSLPDDPVIAAFDDPEVERRYRDKTRGSSRPWETSSNRDSAKAPDNAKELISNLFGEEMIGFWGAPHEEPFFLAELQECLTVESVQLPNLQLPRQFVVSEVRIGSVARNDAHGLRLELIAYGWRRDTTIYELLNPLPALITIDPARGRTAVAKVQPLCERVLEHTDGKDTRHAMSRWWQLLAAADPCALSRLVQRRFVELVQRSERHFARCSIRLVARMVSTGRSDCCWSSPANARRAAGSE